MRVVVQRVAQAAVRVDGSEVGAIGPGLLILLGVAAGDTAEDGAWLAGKIAQLRHALAARRAGRPCRAGMRIWIPWNSRASL